MRVAGQGRRARYLSSKAAVVRLLIIVLAVVVWELLVRLGLVDELFVSSPGGVASALVAFTTDEAVISALGETLQSILLAFVIGTGLGLVVGTALGLSAVLKEAFMPPILFLLSTPKSMFLPLFVLLLGISTTTAVAFGAYTVFFYVVVNVIGGVELVESQHLRLARAFRASRLDTFRHIIFPASLPGFFAALWHGMTHAVSAVLLAQLFVAIGGLGTLMSIYSSTMQTDNALALAVLVSVIAIVLASFWSIAERRMTSWRADL